MQCFVGRSALGCLHPSVITARDSRERRSVLKASGSVIKWVTPKTGHVCQSVQDRKKAEQAFL